MRPIKLLIKIVNFGLLLGSFSMGGQLLAGGVITCPKDFPKSGAKFKFVDKNQWKVIVTESKALGNALNNESLEEHLAVLKLDAVERFQKFLETKTYSTPNKYGGTKLTVLFDSSWDRMKRSIASMKELKTCIQEDRILFIGEWSSKSITRANKIIDFQEIINELIHLEMEDPEFELEQYPNLLNQDPEIIKDFIENWRNNRGL